MRSKSLLEQAKLNLSMKAASSLPKKRHPARYSSETATSRQHLFLSLLPAPTD